MVNTGTPLFKGTVMVNSQFKGKVMVYINTHLFKGMLMVITNTLLRLWVI